MGRIANMPKMILPTRMFRSHLVSRLSVYGSATIFKCNRCFTGSDKGRAARCRSIWVDRRRAFDDRALIGFGVPAKAGTQGDQVLRYPGLLLAQEHIVLLTCVLMPLQHSPAALSLAP